MTVPLLLRIAAIKKIIIKANPGRLILYFDKFIFNIVAHNKPLVKNNHMTEQNNKENWIRKALTSEVKYAIAIIIFVVGGVAPFYSIKQDVALIKQNHLAHIEQIQKDIKENSDSIKELKEVQVKVLIEIATQISKEAK